MIRAYREWSEWAGWSEPSGPLPWTDFVLPGWQGHCAYCGRRLTDADWQNQRIAAAGDGDPWHCICLSHLQAGHQEYSAAVLALARALAGV